MFRVSSDTGHQLAPHPYRPYHLRPYFAPAQLLIPPPVYYGYVPAPSIAPPPAYYYPAPAVAPPPVYVERSDSDWYYCDDGNAY